MVTNKKLYDMITERVNNGNEDLREQLKSQIADRAAQTQTMAQELADRQSEEISKLSAGINYRLNMLQSELHSEIDKATAESSEKIVKELVQDYDAKIGSLRAELIGKIDESTYQIMKVSQVINDGIENLQKDTAVIMETLQLLLTNMMLDKVESGKEKHA